LKGSGAELVKVEKKEDSDKLAAFKQEQRDKRAAEKAAKKTKKTKKDGNWKVTIGNTSIGNASNPKLQKKKEPTTAEKKEKMDAIEARSNKGYKIS